MICHSGIFYPSDKEEIEKLVAPVGDERVHKAFILPHMELRSVAALYRMAFSSIRNGMRIVAILPIHRELLMRDEGKLMLTSAERTEETPLGKVRIGSLGCGDVSPYEEEEYSLELLYPFAAAHTPDSLLCPIFTRLKSADDSRKLTAMLQKLDDGNTVFITSSNMTAKLPESEIAAKRDRVIDMLTKGEHLIDLWRKGHITACGAPAIEAVSRLGSGRWTLMGISEKETKAGHAALYMD